MHHFADTYVSRGFRAGEVSEALPEIFEDDLDKLRLQC